MRTFIAVGLLAACASGANGTLTIDLVEIPAPGVEVPLGGYRFDATIVDTETGNTVGELTPVDDGSSVVVPPAAVEFVVKGYPQSDDVGVMHGTLVRDVGPVAMECRVDLRVLPGADVGLELRVVGDRCNVSVRSTDGGAR